MDNREDLNEGSISDAVEQTTDKDSFKERLLFYMRKRHLNPTSLSRKAMLNMTAVRDILAHEKTPNPRIDTFIKLCHALGISPHHLSPDFEKFYSSPLLELLNEMDDLNEQDRQAAEENRQGAKE